MNCPICSKEIPAGRHTCGSSYCQEADFYLNVARNARKNSKKRADAQAYANAIMMTQSKKTK